MTDSKIEVSGTLGGGADPVRRLREADPAVPAPDNHALRDVPGLVDRLTAAEARSDALKSENALYLLQIEQIQQELERQFERNQWQGERIRELQRQLAGLQMRLAELQMRLEFESVPWRKKLSRTVPVYLKHVVSSFAGGHEREFLRSLLAIRLSGLFDERWYLETYPDVAQANLDPVEHYMKFGAVESRNPSALFDSRWYLENYPDVAQAGFNPLAHYVLFGRREGRRPVRSIA